MGWTRRGTVFILVAVLTPIAVERGISYIKGEEYSLDRAAQVLGGVVVVLLLLAAARSFGRNLRILLAVLLLLAGIGTSALGLLALLGRVLAIEELGLTLLCLGLLISLLAGYAVFVERSGADFSFAAERQDKAAVHQEIDDGRPMLLVKFPSFIPDDEEVVATCQAGVDAADLHFIGYYVDGRCRFHLDVLRDPSLNKFFRRDSREQRRLEYERAGRQVDWIISRLNVYLRRLEGGILIRTVLDVEHGALYYYWIDTNVYLVGATMDQARVVMVDDKLNSIATRIGILPRGGPLGLARQGGEPSG